jgi:hypothetical protein
LCYCPCTLTTSATGVSRVYDRVQPNSKEYRDRAGKELNNKDRSGEELTRIQDTPHEKAECIHTFGPRGMIPGCRRSLRMPAKNAIVGRFERLIVMRVWWNVMSGKCKITIISILQLTVIGILGKSGSVVGSASRAQVEEISPYTKTVKLAAIAASIAPRVSSGCGVRVAIHTRNFVSKGLSSENRNVQVKIVCIYNDILLPIPETSGFAQIP